MNKGVFFGCIAFLLLLVVGCSTLRVNNDLIVDRVRSAVENNLAAKGYAKVDSASADFVVSWLGGIDKKLQVESIDHFYSPYRVWSIGQRPILERYQRCTNNHCQRV